MCRTAIYGASETGKTTYARNDARGHLRKNRRIVLFGRRPDDSWERDGIKIDKKFHLSEDNSDLEEMRAKVARFGQTNFNCHFIFDDCTVTIGKDGGPLRWFATDLRHMGHSVTIIAHEFQGFDPIIRASSQFIACFAVGNTSAKALSEACVFPEFLKAPSLMRGEHIYFDKMNRTGGFRKGKKPSI